MGGNRWDHLLPGTFCAFSECWFVLLVGLLVFPFLPHLCRLTQGAAFLLWITSRPSSEFILHYLQTKQWIHPALPSDRYFLQFCAPWNIPSPWYPFADWSEISIFPYTVSTCLFPLNTRELEDFQSGVPELFALACSKEKARWDVGFLQNGLRMGAIFLV